VCLYDRGACDSGGRLAGTGLHASPGTAWRPSWPPAIGGLPAPDAGHGLAAPTCGLTVSPFRLRAKPSRLQRSRRSGGVARLLTDEAGLPWPLESSSMAYSLWGGGGEPPTRWAVSACWSVTQMESTAGLRPVPRGRNGASRPRASSPSGRVAPATDAWLPPLAWNGGRRRGARHRSRRRGDLGIGPPRTSSGPSSMATFPARSPPGNRRSGRHLRPGHERAPPPRRHRADPRGQRRLPPARALDCRAIIQPWWD